MSISPINSFFFAMLLCCLCLTGCKKLVEVGPPVNSMSAATVYANDATAAAVLTGVYSSMGTYGLSSGTSFNNFLSYFSELSADNLTLWSGESNPTIANYYLDNLDKNSAPNIWGSTYLNLFPINAAIEGLTSSSGLTPAVKQQLLGEAKFLRAFNYFYLVTLYGKVPLVLSTDYRTNSLLARSDTDQVYDQIIADLKEAQGLLTDGYAGADAKSSTTERVRPNKWAATALLARAYLYKKDYQDAETQASAVISESGLFGMPALDSVFLANSREAIWQLQPVNVGHNTEDAWGFIPLSTGPDGSHDVYLSAALLNSFEPGDLRRIHWVDSVTAGGLTYYYPYKYKSATLNAPVTEYEMLLRLGELYLIRAEARAESGEGNATDDLNVIRHRAGLPDYTGPTDKTSLLAAIMRERRSELFTELGHRWLDLKRTGAVDAVMTTATTVKGGTWKSYQQWYPVPFSDKTRDPNLAQNEGY